jgi:hypothetical protein
LEPDLRKGERREKHSACSKVRREEGEGKEGAGREGQGRERERGRDSIPYEEQKL